MDELKTGTSIEIARLQKVYTKILSRLEAGTFTHFPGNPKKAVTGIRWNVGGTQTFLLVYWVPVSDTFDDRPYRHDAIWRGSTAVNAWERYLGIVLPETLAEAWNELQGAAAYTERELTEADTQFVVLRGDRSQRDPECVLAEQDAGDLGLEGFTEDELNWQ
jgi:hypothetical protein